MATHLESPPFERGTTFYSGGTIDSNDLGGKQYEGKEYEFEDVLLTGLGAAGVRGNNKVRVRLVRNVNASALLPKQVTKFNASGATVQAIEGQSNGVAGAGDIPAGAVDEFLPAAGCPQNDICYLVIDGNALVTTVASGTVAITKATTVIVTGTGGKVIQQDTTQTGAGVFTQTNAVLGVAMETSVANNADITVRIKTGRNS